MKITNYQKSYLVVFMSLFRHKCFLLDWLLHIAQLWKFLRCTFKPAGDHNIDEKCLESLSWKKHVLNKTLVERLCLFLAYFPSKLLTSSVGNSLGLSGVLKFHLNVEKVNWVGNVLIIVLLLISLKVAVFQIKGRNPFKIEPPFWRVTKCCSRNLLIIVYMVFSQNVNRP